MRLKSQRRPEIEGLLIAELLALLLLWLIAGRAHGADITAGYVFTDGEKNITHTKLNSMISGATINSTFLSGKSSVSESITTDEFFILRSSVYYRLTLGSGVFGSSNLIVNRTANTTPLGSQVLIGYNPSTLAIEKSTLAEAVYSSTNLVWLQPRTNNPGTDFVLLGGDAARSTWGTLRTNLLWDWQNWFQLTTATNLTNPAVGDLTYMRSGGTNAAIYITNLLVAGYSTNASLGSNDVLLVYNIANNSLQKVRLWQLAIAVTNIASTGAGLASAWGVITNTAAGTAPAVQNANNIASVSRLAAGQYQVTFSNALANTNYCAVISSARSADDSSTHAWAVSNRTTTTMAIINRDQSSAAAHDNNAFSPVNVIVYGP